jgi:hypothetical protein
MKIVVKKVYPPIKASIMSEKGIPARQKPMRYPYPQYLFITAIITPGIIVVSITDKNAKTSYSGDALKIKIMFTHDITKPTTAKRKV